MKNIKISVVIPAYNEEKEIQSTIRRAKKVLNKYIFEIIVVDNASTDNTVIIAKKEGAKVFLNTKRSISITRNIGAKNAKYRYLLFVDADSKINKNLIAKSLNQFKYKHIKAVSCITKYSHYPNLGSRGVWIYNVFSYIFRLGVGQFIFVKKGVFNKLGGFNEEYYAYEELDFFKRVKKLYGRNSFKVLFEPVTSSPRKFEDNKNSPTVFALNLLLAILNPNIGKDKSKLDFWYKSNNNYAKKSSIFKDILGIVIVLMLVFDWFLFTSNSVVRNYSYLTTPFLFLLMTAYLINTKRNLKWFFIIFLSTLFIEVVGLFTGFPFGVYTYNYNYALIGIFGVPFYIGLAWYLIITSITRIVKNPFLTGIFVVLVDIIIEKFAYLNNLWFWEKFNNVTTSPIKNYLAWFIVGFVLYFVARKQQILLKDSYFILVSISVYMVVNICLHLF